MENDLFGPFVDPNFKRFDVKIEVYKVVLLKRMNNK